jgi:hypothetical protein
MIWLQFLVTRFYYAFDCMTQLKRCMRSGQKCMYICAFNLNVKFHDTSFILAAVVTTTADKRKPLVTRMMPNKKRFLYLWKIGSPVTSNRYVVLCCWSDACQCFGIKLWLFVLGFSPEHYEVISKKDDV